MFGPIQILGFDAIKFGQCTLTRCGLPSKGLAVMVFIRRKAKRMLEKRMLIILTEHKRYACFFLLSLKEYLICWKHPAGRCFEG